MAQNHYNGGNTWGRVISVEASRKESGAPFLTIQLDCSGSRGNVRAYGRLWKKERIEPFLAWYKNNPGQMVRLKGFFSQYEKAGEIRSNYTWFDWAPVQCDDPRAAFILRGVVSLKDGFDNTVKLKVIRPGSGIHPDTEEFFVIYLSVEQFGAVEPRDLLEIKGYMQQGEGEDDFGDATGPVRPTAVVVNVLSPF